MTLANLAGQGLVAPGNSWQIQGGFTRANAHCPHLDALIQNPLELRTVLRIILRNLASACGVLCSSPYNDWLLSRFCYSRVRWAYLWL